MQSEANDPPGRWGVIQTLLAHRVPLIDQQPRIWDGVWPVSGHQFQRPVSGVQGATGTPVRESLLRDCLMEETERVRTRVASSMSGGVNDEIGWINEWINTRMPRFTSSKGLVI